MRRNKTKRRLTKKRLILVAAVLLGFVLTLVLSLQLLVNHFASKEYITETLESSIDSKVEIGDVDVSIFSFPAKVSLRDVSLTPRSGDPGKTHAKFDQLDLSVSLWSLLKNEIDISQITITGAKLASVFYEEGGYSLDKLFDKPGSHKSSSGSKKQKGGGLNAIEQSEFIANLGSLSIKNARLDLTIEKTGLRLHGSKLNLDLSSLKIDPANLHKTNSANIQLDGQLSIDSVKGYHYGDLYLTGDVSGKIFNPTTGDVEPNVEGKIKLSDDSWLNTRIPYLTKAWGSLSVLEKVGVNVVKLPTKATFGRSQSLAVRFHTGKLTVQEPLSIWIGDWELAVLNGSWVQFETEQHEINGELLASESASAKFKSIVEKSSSFVPSQYREKFILDFTSEIFRNLRLVVPLKSSGTLSDPDVTAASINLDIKEAAKEYLKKKAGGLLRGLLGGDDDDDDD